MAGEVDKPRWAAEVAAAERLGELAQAWDTTPAALAIAYVLANPRVATVLFGATRPEQVTANVAAAALLERLTDAQRSQLAAVGA